MKLYISFILIAMMMASPAHGERKYYDCALADVLRGHPKMVKNFDGEWSCFNPDGSLSLWRGEDVTNILRDDKKRIVHFETASGKQYNCNYLGKSWNYYPDNIEMTNGEEYVMEANTWDYSKEVRIPNGRNFYTYVNVVSEEVESILDNAMGDGFAASYAPAETKLIRVLNDSYNNATCDSVGNLVYAMVVQKAARNVRDKELSELLGRNPKMRTIEYYPTPGTRTGTLGRETRSLQLRSLISRPMGLIFIPDSKAIDKQLRDYFKSRDIDFKHDKYNYYNVPDFNELKRKYGEFTFHTSPSMFCVDTDGNFTVTTEGTVTDMEWLRDDIISILKEKGLDKTGYIGENPELRGSYIVAQAKKNYLEIYSVIIDLQKDKQSDNFDHAALRLLISFAVQKK